ncbi:hypothetical protein RHIZ404_210124 [Rhizobium sp. EC-SD404]|nr:hypothetical protein RHIZ404_210124 [Rhizobium sp. EC-SD404]
MKGHFGPHCEQDRGDAAKDDDEEGGTVGRIREGVIQPAHLAARSKLQEAVEEMTLATSRTATSYADAPWFEWGVLVVIMLVQDSVLRAIGPSKAIAIQFGSRYIQSR